MFGSALRKAINETSQATKRDDADSLRKLPQTLLPLVERASRKQSEQVIELCAIATDIIGRDDGPANHEWFQVAAKYYSKGSGSEYSDSAMLHVAANMATACVKNGDYQAARKSWEVADVDSRFFTNEETAEYLSSIAADCTVAAAMIQDVPWMKRALSVVLKFVDQFRENAGITNSLVGAMSAISDDRDACQLVSDSTYWDKLSIEELPWLARNEANANLFAIFAYFVIQNSNNQDTIVYWATQTKKIASRWGNAVEIQGYLANAAAQTIIHCRLWDPESSWAKLLQEIAKQYSTVPQIQALHGMAALNACLGIVDCEFDRSIRERKLRPWIDYLIESLTPSGLDETTFLTLAQIALQNTTELESNEFVRLCFAIHRYWPGLRGKFGEDHAVNFGDVIKRSPVFQIADHHGALAGAMELNSELMAIQRLALDLETGDAESLAIVWEKRMFLADRGGSLIPNLQELKLQRAYAEGVNDPWRVEARWHPRKDSVH